MPLSKFTYVCRDCKAETTETKPHISDTYTCSKCSLVQPVAIVSCIEPQPTPAGDNDPESRAFNAAFQRNIEKMTGKGRHAQPPASGIESVLAERGSRYGDFRDHGFVTQNIKSAMRASKKWVFLTPAQQEALEMIAHKIGRILNGDPNYKDSWVDIEGYAHLISQALETSEEAVGKFVDNLLQQNANGELHPPVHEHVFESEKLLPSTCEVASISPSETHPPKTIKPAG
jgi:hypothetical protein